MVGEGAAAAVAKGQPPKVGLDLLRRASHHVVEVITKSTI